MCPINLTLNFFTSNCISYSNIPWRVVFVLTKLQNTFLQQLVNTPVAAGCFPLPFSALRLSSTCRVKAAFSSVCTSPTNDRKSLKHAAAEISPAASNDRVNVCCWPCAFSKTILMLHIVVSSQTHARQERQLRSFAKSYRPCGSRRGRRAWFILNAIKRLK